MLFEKLFATRIITNEISNQNTLISKNIKEVFN